MNKNKNSVKKRERRLPRALSKIALKIFFGGLSVILLYLIAVIILILSTPDIPPYILSRIHFDTLEHIVMSATLIIIGTAVIDLCEKEREQNC